MRISFCLAVCIAVLCVAASCHIAAEEKPAAEKKQDSLDRDYSGELPRIDPVSPKQALKTFKIQRGFQLQQAAAEPNVADPTALAFDENGRLFVVEMRGYSEDGDKDLGVIRLLEDRDADGRFEHSTIFVDDLAWPTAVACWDGGIFVGVAPDILYCKDTDGDGRADVSKKVFTGFGRSNVQGLLNSLTWGLDNRIHGATSSSGGVIENLVHPDARPVSLRGRDFAIDPRAMTIHATSGGAQHGLSFDRWGRKFVCSNSDHAQMVMYEDRYVARNPYLAAPSPRISIASDGRQATVFRASPVEPWRIVRTRLRLKGLVRGPVEGGGTPAGYFTGSTGITIYRGHAFPDAYQGNLFVADCGSNLVHRKTLRADGLELIADRADPGREFLASRDIWFRPVQMAGAPDGALYVMDMSREVIEHPKSLPPVIKKHLDLTSGRDRGRIYRIVPRSFEQTELPQLSEAATADVVRLLAHPNGWHRDTAARLLYERQDRTAVELLEKMVQDGSSSVGRVHALYALAGLGALREEIVVPALENVHPRVREHALRAGEAIAPRAPRMRARMYRMVDDPDPLVRYQLAFSLGEIGGPQRNEALAKLAISGGGNRWMRVAILSSLADGAGQVLARVVEDEAFRESGGGKSLVAQLAQQIGKQRRKDDVAALLAALSSLAGEDAGIVQTIISNVTKAAAGKIPQLEARLAAATGGRAEAVLKQFVASSLETALEHEQPAEARAEAIRALAVGTYEELGEPLVTLVDHRQPLEVQLAALATLGEFRDPAVARDILSAFERLSPRLRSEALEVIFARKPWLEQLLAAVEAGKFATANVDPARIALLAAHPDEQIRAQAQPLFATSRLSARKEVIEQYRPALALEGDVDHGRKTFRKICAACHRLENVGHEIGKNLASVREKGPEQILVNVLDPNREVDPKYITYVAQTEGGRALSGIIAAETATSITLKRAENAQDTLLRIEIEALKSTGKSIMPEGLEKKIDKQAMADLIAYLRSVE